MGERLDEFEAMSQVCDFFIRPFIGYLKFFKPVVIFLQSILLHTFINRSKLVASKETL